MNKLMLRDSPSVDGVLVSWRDRRQLAEARLQARLAKFWECAEAERLHTRIRSGRELADVATDEFVTYTTA